MDLNLGVVSGCVRDVVKGRHNVASVVVVTWCAGEKVYGEVSEKGCGVAVKCLWGEMLKEFGAIRLLPDWNDEKFGEVKVG